MKFLRCALILWLTLALNASANDIDGTWKAVFVGPMDQRPKMVSEMVFDLRTTISKRRIGALTVVGGKQFTGMAHMANWPGDAPISEGRIEGNRISFTAVGRMPWESNEQGGASSGYPRLRFNGTIHRNDMKLTLIWDSVLIYGKMPDSSKLEMVGKKISEAR